MSTNIFKGNLLLGTGSSFSTSTAFTDKEPTVTKPTGDQVIDVTALAEAVSVGAHVPDHIELIPVGTDAADETFDMRLWGWTFEPGNGMYWPRLLVELNCTLGTADLPAALATNGLLCDTISLAAGDSDASLNSPANDTIANALVDIRGCDLVEIDFDSTGAASMNVHYRFVD